MKIKQQKIFLFASITILAVIYERIGVFAIITDFNMRIASIMRDKRYYFNNTYLALYSPISSRLARVARMFVSENSRSTRNAKFFF